MDTAVLSNLLLCVAHNTKKGIRGSGTLAARGWSAKPTLLSRFHRLTFRRERRKALPERCYASTYARARIPVLQRCDSQDKIRLFETPLSAIIPSLSNRGILIEFKYIELINESYLISLRIGTIVASFASLRGSALIAN